VCRDLAVMANRDGSRPAGYRAAITTGLDPDLGANAANLAFCLVKGLSGRPSGRVPVETEAVVWEPRREPVEGC
jgi:hypothetical protein